MGDNTDNTQPGYVIRRTEKLAEGVRQMTLFETEMFRLLFHLGCLAGLHAQPEDVSLLCRVATEDIQSYLLDQINPNIAKCARLANLSQDNILLLLADFMKNLPKYDSRNRYNLLNQTGRAELEQAFIAQLRYNVQRLTEKVGEFKAVVKEDAEKSALQDLLSGAGETSTLSRLLRVRSRVTGDNLLQWMITNDKMTSCPTLASLLENITVLQELVNLPDILRLQSYLLERFSGKISSTEMEQLTILQFSERVEETFRPRFLQLAEAVLQTWNKLKEKVSQYGGIMSAEIRNLEVFSQEIYTTRSTPAAFLFPASKSSGLCSYALVMFLVDSHNKVARSNLPPINPYQASPYHLSVFKKSDLQSLLLSHTSYTFPRSGYTKEEYDIAGMERKVVERLVLSNPRLEGEVRKVQYLEDRTGREEDQLDSKIDQTELDNNLQTQLGKVFSLIHISLK